MRRWNSYLLGILVLMLFLGVLNIIIGQKVLDITDIFIPYYEPSQYLSSFFSLWKTGDVGGISNAPLSTLVGGVLSLIGITYVKMQFIIFSILVFFAFTSIYILISYLSNGKNILSLFFAFLFLLIEFRWAGFVGATGLNYFLAFSPLLIYFFIKMVRSEMSKISAVISIALSLIGASFAITEAVPYSLFIYSPLLIMALIDIIILKHNLTAVKIFVKTQITFLSGILLGIFVLIYIYYPWILGGLGIGNSYSTAGIGQTYRSTNFFIANSFSSLLAGPAVFGTVMGFTGTLAAIVGSLFLLILLPYVIKRRSNVLLLSAYFFIVLVTLYIQLAISFPDQLFRLIASIPVLTSLLITLNEPAQMYYIVAIWAYVIITMAFFDFLQNYHVVFKTLFKHIPNCFLRSFVRLKNKSRIKVMASIFVVTLLVLLSYGTASSIYNTSNGYAVYTPYGNYKIPNYIPNYVRSIYNVAANNSGADISKVLLLPDYPRVERWEQTSPYFYTFPPANSFQMNLFKLFISDIQAGSKNGTAPILNQMDIGYIAVVKALNQTKTGPSIGYDNFNQPYAIFGNPSIFYSYFNNSPDYRLIQSNDNYALFENTDNTGLFQDFSSTGLVSNASVHYTIKNNSVLKSPPPNSSEGNLSATTANILQGIIKRKYWTPFGHDVSENFSNATIQLDFPSNATGAYSSYLGFQLPVSPGDELLFSTNITSLDGSNTTYYNGLLYSKSKSSTMYNVSDNNTVEVSGNYTVPNNSSSLLPYMEFKNPHGKFIIDGITLRVIKSGNSSSYVYPGFSSENNTVLTNSSLESEMNSLFPSLDTLFLNNSEATNGLTTINVSVYRGSINSPGIYTVPLYYILDKYGYVGGNGNYTVMNPGSYAWGNLTPVGGSYAIFLKVSGSGFGSLVIGGSSYTYNTLASHSYFFKLNKTVKSNLTFLINNIIGQIRSYDLVLVGPNVSSSLIDSLTSLRNDLNYTLIDPNYTSGMGLKINTSVTSIMVMKEGYSTSWEMTYTDSGKVHHELPFLVNGWEMGFKIPREATDIAFRFTPPLLQESQIYITAISFPLLMLTSLLTFLFSFKRKEI